MPSMVTRRRFTGKFEGVGGKVSLKILSEPHKNSGLVAPQTFNARRRPSRHASGINNLAQVSQKPCRNKSAPLNRIKVQCLLIDGNLFRKANLREWHPYRATRTRPLRFNSHRRTFCDRLSQLVLTLRVIARRSNRFDFAAGHQPYPPPR